MTADESGGDARGWRRWRGKLVSWGSWALDVFRGHADSRHLDNQEK